MIKQTVYYIASCEKNPYETGSHMALETGSRMALETGSHMALETGSHMSLETGSHMALITLTKLTRWIAIITFNTEFKMLKIDFFIGLYGYCSKLYTQLTER